MSDYLYCTSCDNEPGLIRIRTSRDDPRQDTLEAKLRRREMGQFTLEWTLPVVDQKLSEAALLKTLRKHRDRKASDRFTCDPMHARGEAIKLTTLRPDPRKTRKLSLIRRMIRAA